MNERIAKYADRMAAQPSNLQDAAALGLIQGALICARDDADAVTRIRDVLAAVDLLRDQAADELAALLAAVRPGGAQ